MNQEQYFKALEKINNRTSLKTIDECLDYCGYSVNPFGHLTKKDLQNSEKILIYAWNTVDAQFHAKRYVEGYRGLLHFVKNRCYDGTMIKNSWTDN